MADTESVLSAPPAGRALGPGDSLSIEDNGAEAAAVRSSLAKLLDAGPVTAPDLQSFFRPLLPEVPLEVLPLESLGEVFHDDWINRNLHMDAASWDADLATYIRRLVAAASPKRAVLQFNRVDFRLTTHNTGGITQRDIKLAEAINRLLP